MKGDVASALSGNSIVGRKEKDASLESKMLLFNGLFYQGDWLWPFKTSQSEDKKYFNALSGKQDVAFISSSGTFKYAGNFKNLAAIEIPYKVKSDYDVEIRNLISFYFLSERALLTFDCYATF